MRKLIIAAALSTAALLPTTASAASLTSVTCSLNSIALTFDGNIASGDVTKVEIGEGASAKLKYEIDLLPGSISGAVLTLSTDATAQGQIRKVLPYKAHIYATGTSSGVQKCNAS